MSDPQSALLDEDTIAEIQMMARHSGRDVLGNFLARAENGEVLEITKLCAAAERQDHAQVRADLHRLKGTAGMYGLARLAEAATTLYAQAQHTTIDPAQLAELERIAADSLVALRDRLKAG
jgi:HPt (histidine-containing phosphotransfer) domain-containing protein